MKVCQRRQVLVVEVQHSDSTFGDDSSLPLLLVQDSFLPGQVMELASADGKFQQFLKQLDKGEDELCVVGMHPYNPGEPLNVGVSVTIESIQHNSLLKVRGKEIVLAIRLPRVVSWPIWKLRRILIRF